MSLTSLQYYSANTKCPYELKKVNLTKDIQDFYSYNHKNISQILTKLTYKANAGLIEFSAGFFVGTISLSDSNIGEGPRT